MKPHDMKDFVATETVDYTPGRYAMGSFGAHELVDRLGTVINHLRLDVAAHPAMYNPDPEFDSYRHATAEAISILTGVLISLGRKHGNSPNIN